MSTLFESLPGDTGLAYIVVLHLDPTHASFLTEILATNARMPVTPAQDDLAIEPNHVYVITPNTTLTVSGGHMRVRPRSDETRLHLPVDALFASLAEALDNRSIGVLLSGTGSDGTLGTEAIKSKGGITFAQDQGTARFFGMPGSAVASGCVDFVLAPGDIAKEIVRIARHPYLEDAPIEPSADEWKRLFRILRGAYGVDFASYKRSTIRRRLLRRLALSRVDGVAAYLERLVRDTAELQALYQDLLIRVTSFFRDPETFEALTKEVFPSHRRSSRAERSLRIWVPGCATGEEVYSIAIALYEFLGDATDTMQLQIFGTDVNPLAIERARAARYVQNIEVDISPERLRRFFVKIDDHYEVAKRIRDACIFAVQNVGRDPPFSRLDLVSCRNLLIYLDAPLQKRVIQIFHYALNPNGFLVLAPSETIGQGAELFLLTNQRQKIYRRIGGGHRLPAELLHGERGAAVTTAGRRTDDGGELQTERAQREADQLLITRFAPAALLVDDRLAVVHFRGHIAPYLEQQPGTASLQLSKLVHPALLVELIAAIEDAESNGSSRRENLRLANSASGARIDIEVTALKRRRSRPLHADPVRAPPRGSRAARRPASGSAQLRAADVPLGVADVERRGGARARRPGAASRFDARVPHFDHRGERGSAGRAALGERGSAVGERGVPEHERGARNRQGGAAVGERGARDDQRGALPAQRRARAGKRGASTGARLLAGDRRDGPHTAAAAEQATSACARRIARTASTSGRASS